MSENELFDTLHFNADNLVPTIVQDATTRDVLMMRG